MRAKDKMAIEPLVYVVLLNWNGIEHLPVCLDSLKRQTYDKLRVVMVDNGSTDGSVEFAHRNFPGIEIIANKRNIGFARANNQGLNYAAEKGARYVVILNNDTECEPDFVSELVSVAESDKRIAACAPKILYFRTRDIINGIGTDVSLFGYGWDRGVGEKDEGQYDRICEVFGVSGGAMLIRTDVVKELGGFDPTYFIYFEDIDLSWRIRSWGYRIVAVPRAIVYHKFSATMGRMKLRKEFLSEKNRIRTVLKNFELRYLIKVICRMAYFDFQRVKSWWLEKGDTYSVKRGLIVLGAYLWNLLYLPSLIRHRRQAMKGRKLGDSEMMQFLTPVMGGCAAVIPHYRLVNRELFSKLDEMPKEIVMGVTDDRSLGAGWGNVVDLKGGRGNARPASKKAYFYLPGGEARTCTLILYIFGCPSKRISGTVEINGREIGSFSVEANSERIVKFNLPEDVAACKVLEGCIISNQTWRPNDFYKDRDYREFGPLVKRISLRRNGS